MKDKRTYENAKEHGEDITHENETQITVNNKHERKHDDLTLLIEMHKKEIWKWKQKESEWIKTENQLQGAKGIIDELSSRLVKAFAEIALLEKKLAELKK